MKGHIFLSGGGDREDTVILDRKYFDLLSDGAKVLYIPIALNKDTAGFAACYDWFSGCVSMHKGDKKINVTMILMEDEIPELSQFEAVYIGGGDTFKLLDYVIRKGLDKKLPEYVEAGGVLYGGSAGAIILGKDINTVKEENEYNFSYNLGLNMIGGVSFHCHYEEKLDDKIRNAAIEVQTPVIAMPEDSGIAIHPDSVEIVGNVLLFNPEKKQLEQSQLEQLLQVHH